MDIEIRIIEYNSPAYYAGLEFRDRILRKPLGLNFSPKDINNESNEIHIMAFIGNETAGTLLLKPEDKDTVRMRQVAVSEKLQGNGIGTKMVIFSEQYARQLGFTKMILHARTTAVPFYEHLGYQKTGSEYTEVTIPHYTMFKMLDNAETNI